MVPKHIILHQQSNTLELGYTDNSFKLPAVYLRANSPSADVKKYGPGHHPNVRLKDAKIVGNYALQLYFDDGHNSGIYNWEYLRLMCVEMKNEQAQHGQGQHSKAQQSPQPQAVEAQPLHIRPAKPKP